MPGSLFIGSKIYKYDLRKKKKRCLPSIDSATSSSSSSSS